MSDSEPTQKLDSQSPKTLAGSRPGKGRQMWWKHLIKNGEVEVEARRMISLLGSGAYEAAYETARRLRSKDKVRARYYAGVALRIAELTSQETGVDPRADKDVRPRIVSRLV